MQMHLDAPATRSLLQVAATSTSPHRPTSNPRHGHPSQPIDWRRDVRCLLWLCRATRPVLCWYLAATATAAGVQPLLFSWEPPSRHPVNERANEQKVEAKRAENDRGHQISDRLPGLPLALADGERVGKRQCRPPQPANPPEPPIPGLC